MSGPLFLRNVIAFIWDFDRTLIPGYMETPIFEKYNVDEKKFWAEVNSLTAFYEEQGTRVNRDTIYLLHILTYVRENIFKGLNNYELRKLGENIEFYPGMPEFLPHIKKLIEKDCNFSGHEIRIEHYIVSTGIRQIIVGTDIAKYADDIWACDFIEDIAPPNYLEEPSQMVLFDKKEDTKKLIQAIGYTVDNTSKTRAIFEINKGANKIDRIDVNSTIPYDERRIPFQNMIYIADGPSDVPVFSLLNRFKGKTFAVYPQGDIETFKQVKKLQEEKRVQSFGEAIYEKGSQTYLWLVSTANEIANKIVEDRERIFGEKVKAPPKHLD